MMKFKKRELFLGEYTEELEVMVDKPYIKRLKGDIYDILEYKGMKKDKHLSNVIRNIISKEFKKRINAYDIKMPIKKIVKVCEKALTIASNRIKEEVGMVINISEMYVGKNPDTDVNSLILDVNLFKVGDTVDLETADIEVRTITLGECHSTDPHDTFIYTKKDMDELYSSLANILLEAFSVHMTKREFKAEKKDIKKQCKKVIKNIGQNEMVIDEKDIVDADKMLEVINNIITKVKKKADSELYLETLYKYVDSNYIMNIDFAILTAPFSEDENKLEKKKKQKDKSKKNKKKSSEKDDSDKKKKKKKSKKRKLSKKDEDISEFFRTANCNYKSKL